MKLWSRLKKNKIRSSIAYTIKPRKVKFEWQDSPIDWIPNQPFASYFINEINNFIKIYQLKHSIYCIIAFLVFHCSNI